MHGLQFNGATLPIILSFSQMETRLKRHSEAPMEEEEEEEDREEVNENLPTPNPSFWFKNLVYMQADITYNCIIAALSPFFSIISLASESLNRTEEVEKNVQSAVHNAPWSVAQSSALLLRKVGMGFLGAAYVCMILILLMVLAAILGVGLVRMWVEEPVFLRENLQFDYSDVNPKSVLYLGADAGGGGVEGQRRLKKSGGIPAGHTLYVSVVLLMPESDFNRDVGVFQMNSELISENGRVIEKSSHPCMLRFRSWPIRLMRTYLMGIPLLLGITAETQRIVIPMLKHKEGFPRSEAIAITLIPRAGTLYLPQLYEAEIILRSQPPWEKEMVRRWKRTFYVWTSLYIYITLLIILLCWFRPLVIPVMTSYVGQNSVAEEPEERKRRVSPERSFSETLRRLQQTRSKRKAMLEHTTMVEQVSSSASTITVSREDTGATNDEDEGDSESVCFRSGADGE